MQASHEIEEKDASIKKLQDELAAARAKAAADAEAARQQLVDELARQERDLSTKAAQKVRGQGGEEEDGDGTGPLP